MTKPVTWFSGNTGIAPITAAGLVTIKSGQGYGLQAISLNASTDNGSASTTINVRDWTYALNSNGLTYAQILALSQSNPSLYLAARLYAQCNQASKNFSAYVDLGIWNADPARPDVTVRWAGEGNSSTANWSSTYSSDGFHEYIFYPGDASAFVTKLAQKDTVVIRYNVQYSGADTVRFVLTGFQYYLPKVQAACG